MAGSKFAISYGETGGSKQVTFYYCSKINFAELREIIAREFPCVPETSLNVFPGIVNCVITDGKSLEVPTT